MVVANLHKNAENAQRVIRQVVQQLSAHPPASDAHSALQYAILTPLNQVPAATKQKLQLLLQKYL
jgi:5'-methylthioadenosine phosphorylase